MQISRFYLYGSFHEVFCLNISNSIHHIHLIILMFTHTVELNVFHPEVLSKVVLGYYM